ncbi:molybdopterin-dependent oxidoreductase [Halomicrobium sp. LC1Hm]|uniref:molybdopterin-dependent oxidoreductase n=1 Tax=Halomicrobium sp. LC1Hm TaxID=2610902 RepID=UPI0012982743|nr:molybdopterin-dependent oxidoreductase [Halomicrobium sp. LC1Hm]QGA82120.1 Periplasmic DMSO/TMAO reductase YedYZ, molybdopterin-dependent catalytic subunit [Halomicrobium sp. LC1Hm]
MTRFARLRPSADDAVALFAGVAAVVGSFAAVGFTPSFVASPIERWLARRMPGAVVSLAIQFLGSLGQQLNLVAAALAAVCVVAAVARVAGTLGDRLANRAVGPVVAGAVVFGVATLLTGSVPSSGGAAVGTALTLGLAGLSGSLPARGATNPDRRRVLASLGTAAGLGVVASVLTDDTSQPTATIPDDASPAVRDALEAATEQSLAVDGLEPLVSDEFFSVDINAVDPEVDASQWTLSVTGSVEEEITVDYEQLRSMDARTEFHTLRCVGESLNGTKMDNALWTGVPVRTLLERAAPDSDCDCVRVHAADDYYQVFPIDALNGAMLAYQMNGRPLPQSHGYPARALVPGHWGEINVKWITEIEVIDRDAEGYWEERGWHGTGPVETVAKIHAQNALPDGRVQVGGHAYAGTRGVSAVEVSTDGGDSWSEARLSEPLVESVDWAGDPGETPHAPDVWRQWAFEYEPPAGEHEVVARAIEADGTVQPETEREAFPHGPSGWVSRTVE